MLGIISYTAKGGYSPSYGFAMLNTFASKQQRQTAGLGYEMKLMLHYPKGGVNKKPPHL